MVTRRIELGDEDRRPPASRIEHGGTREYPVESHREAKPAVDSVDVEFAAVPAREQSKVNGTFGVDAPYDQRTRA